jgi:hypothetical protein
VSVSEAAPGPKGPTGPDDPEPGPGESAEAGRTGEASGSGDAGGTSGTGEGGDASGTGEAGGTGDAGGTGERRVVVTRRRAPRYRAFGVTGALIGIVAGLALGLLIEPEAGSEYTQQAITGYFVAGLGLIGTLLGLTVALLAERRR